MTHIKNAALAAVSIVVLACMAIQPVQAAGAATKRIDAARLEARAKAEAFFRKIALVRPANPARMQDGDMPSRAKTSRAMTGKAVAQSAHDGLIARYAAAEGVPLLLAHAVIRIESNYRVNARGSAGEVGLMQIKPATARGMGYRGSVSGLYDPATNLRWGMKYLGKAHQLGGGQTCGTILKYNAGHGAKQMNKVSSAYCGKVKAQMRRA